MSRPWCSVVVPAYNEQKRIVRALEKVCAFLSLKTEPWEVIVVNDGSSDGTSLVVDEFIRLHPQWRVRMLVFQPNHGKGYACRQGVMSAEGHTVLLTDADLSSPIKECDKLLAALKEGADVAIGSRAVRSPGCDVRQTFKRRVAGRVFNVLVQGLLLPGLKDTQCGFKAFTREAARSLFGDQKLDGFSFDVEILYLARLRQMKVREVAVMWSQDEDSRVSMLRDSLRMASDLFKIKALHR